MKQLGLLFFLIINVQKRSQFYTQKGVKCIAVYVRLIGFFYVTQG